MTLDVLGRGIALLLIVTTGTLYELLGEIEDLGRPLRLSSLSVLAAVAALSPSPILLRWGVDTHVLRSWDASVPIPGSKVSCSSRVPLVAALSRELLLTARAIWRLFDPLWRLAATPCEGVKKDDLGLGRGEVWDWLMKGRLT